MAEYVIETHHYDSDGFSTAGRIVDILSHSTTGSRLTVLVEKEALALQPFEVPPEGMSLEEIQQEITAGDVAPVPEENTATCSGKDGDCSRTVDEPGDYCWQHETDSE